MFPLAGRCLLAVLTLSIAAAAHDPAVCTFNVFKIPDAATLPNAIDGSAAVVGYSIAADGTTQGFTRSSGGTLASFNPPNAIASGMQATNSLGHQAGWFTSPDQHTHAFLLQGSDFEPIDFPDSPDTWATGINNDDEIVGGYRTAAGYDGFLLRHKHFTRIHFPGSSTTWANAINDFGIIVGWYWVNGIQHGFVRIKEKYFTLDAGSGTSLNGINNSGEIVGVYFPQIDPQGFIYTNGEFRDVTVPGSAITNLDGLNDKGQITGPAYFSDGYSGYIGTCNSFGKPAPARLPVMHRPSTAVSRANAQKSLEKPMIGPTRGLD